MFRALVLLTFVASALACAPAPPSSPLAVARPQPPATRASHEPVPALASACHAQPSTVYGDEPVAFEIEGSPSLGLVTLQLWDEQGGAVLQDRTSVPGRWQPDIPLLKSGDFRLDAGSRGVSCWVTVNRELARASEAAR